MAIASSLRCSKNIGGWLISDMSVTGEMNEARSCKSTIRMPKRNSVWDESKRGCGLPVLMRGNQKQQEEEKVL